MKKTTLNILILFTFLAMGQSTILGMQKQKTPTSHSTQKRKARTSECPKCKKEVTNLSRHLNIHLKERPYQCPLCNRGFNDSSNYKVHFDKDGNCKKDPRKKHIVLVSKEKECSSSTIHIPLVSSKKYIPTPPIKKETYSLQNSANLQSRLAERFTLEIEHPLHFLHEDSLIERNTYPLHDNCFEWTEIELK